MSLFDALQAGGHLRALDSALANSMRRLDPATPELVAAGAALASLAVAHGHAGFDPARPRLLLDVDLDWPTADAWSTALAASPWVARFDGDIEATQAPLAFDGGLLYLRRYREYERRLAAGLRRIARSSRAVGDLSALAPVFAQLFPDPGSEQARAAAMALLQPLLLVSGGPGTGKTHTIARLLLLLAAQSRQNEQAPLRIALAAPTGRAAERMAQGVRAAVQALCAAGIDPALCDALPVQAQTLHRLLGTFGEGPRFRHDAEHPLALDVIVIDEASMVDLPLMCKLVEAVAPGAALVLLGDPDQLPSVEAGDVLAAIVAAAGDGDACTRAQAQALHPLLGDIAIAADAAAPLQGCRVQLRRGYRQSDALQLAPLAQAISAGDADSALALLRGGSLAGVHFHADAFDPLAPALREVLLAPWRELLACTDPARALQLASRQRLLTALHGGPQGALALNARIEEALAGVRHPPYFHGRLLLVSENNYRQGLFNGDIGVCLRDEDGATRVWFAGGEGLREFHPSTLPAHVGGFAMTVHKAQGSEFDSAWLQLPRQDARPLSRELLYTALTRARDQLHVCADAAVLQAALARRAQRVSGLAARLR